MRTKTHSHVLAKILDQDKFPFSLLYQASEKGHFAPLAKLVLASEQVAARSLLPWEYKSLAEYGEEDFIVNGDWSWVWPDKAWQRDAMIAFSTRITSNLWYHDEGLLFYVPDGDGYRLARKGDAAYDFICRLIEDESVGDLTFCSAPSWAQELFIGRANLESYRIMWGYQGDLSDPLHEQAKSMRRDAVYRETLRRGCTEVPPIFDDVRATHCSESSGQWPWGVYTTQLLDVLAKAANKWWVNYDPSDNTTAPTNDQVAEWLMGQGVGKVMAEKIATILRADGLPNGPRT